MADDGSGPGTRDRIERLRGATGLAVSHVWQEDDGFRKCRILNRAIAEARGDYLILSDGDCIPRDDFVDTHARLARPGFLVSGGRVRLSSAAGSRIETEDVLHGSLFESRWLDRTGALSRRRDRSKLTRSPGRAAWLDRLTTTRATWNGHNASAWKTDLLRVNGFDERMTYPVEDRELGERLRNAGFAPSRLGIGRCARMWSTTGRGSIPKRRRRTNDCAPKPVACPGRSESFRASRADATGRSTGFGRARDRGVPARTASRRCPARRGWCRSGGGVRGARGSPGRSGASRARGAAPGRRSVPPCGARRSG